MRKVPLKPAIFRHSSHAEWGYGIVVQETPDKVYLSFENGGHRIFAKAPKYQHLLIKVDPPADEAAALAARLLPSANSPKSAESQKKASIAAATAALKERARRSAPKPPSTALPAPSAATSASARSRRPGRATGRRLETAQARPASKRTAAKHA
jgi:hypothetical protein